MYRVKFIFGCIEHEDTYAFNFTNLLGGFWVNDEFKIELHSATPSYTFYIMPHMITLIEKVTE